MGKSLPSTSKLHQFTKMATSKSSKSQKHISENRNLLQIPEFRKPETSRSGSITDLKIRLENPRKNQTPIPLSEVVSDCVNRWFSDTLKEASGGDTAMQILVGQMYYSGYGTPKDLNKGKAWITRASKARSSALKIAYKRPGYNVSDSDSDSDEIEDVANGTR